MRSFLLKKKLFWVSAVAWLLAVNVALAWVLAPIFLPIIDNDNGWYSARIARQLHPHFQVIKFVIVVVGVLGFFMAWGRAGSWRKRLIASTACWVTTFSLAVYFAPGVLLGSMFVPGYSVVGTFLGERAPTDYSKEFSWTHFSRIEQGQKLEDVLLSLGPPLREFSLEKGKSVLKYSRPASGGDYWVAGILVDDQKRVERPILHYYVD